MKVYTITFYENGHFCWDVKGWVECNRSFLERNWLTMAALAVCVLIKVVG